MNGKNKKPAPLVLVDIDRKYHSIYKITKVCKLNVFVEALKETGSLIQCHRCQSFGHVQKTAPPHLNA